MTSARRIALALICLLPPAALAHDGYPADCCSGHDCRPARSGEIEMLADGRYRVVPTGETFARWQVRPSFDAGFHRCLYDRTNPESRTFCVLVPAGS
jgi:hypothetical protein